MEQMIVYCKKHQRLLFFFSYTCLFLLITYFSLHPFLNNQSSLVWVMDGYEQHYPTLLYASEYYREFFSNLLQGNLVIPQFDFHIGLGEDIFSTLNYYGFGDPLTLLSMFVDESHMEWFYSFLILLRMYLAGLSFSYVCIKWKKPYTAVLLGSIAYVFCGYMMRGGLRHPFFINPFILFPLLIYTMDLILRKKKTVMFTVWIGITALQGFYFTYMMTIFLVIFAILRYLDLYGWNGIKEITGMISRFALWYLLGIGMAAFMFLPAISGFFSSTRSAFDISNLSLFHSLSYYKELFNHAFAAPGSWDFPAYVVIALPIFLLLCMKKDRSSRFLKAAFLICFLFYIFPFLQSMINGFSYPSNRWSFVLSFLIAYMITAYCYKMIDLTKKQMLGLSIGIIGYHILLYLDHGFSDLYIRTSVILLDIFLGIVYFVYARKIHFKKSIYFFSMLGISISAVTINTFYLYSLQFERIVIEFQHADRTIEIMKETVGHEDMRSYDSGIYRVDTPSPHNANFGMYTNVSSPHLYFSMINANVYNFLNSTKALNASSSTYRVSGIEQRAQLASLLGIKYYIAEEERVASLPAYKDNIKRKDLQDHRTLYENPYALPIGFTYDAYMTKEAFESLSILDRQNTMMESAVIEEPLAQLQAYTPAHMQADIPYEITSTQGISWNGSSLQVTEDHGYMICTIPQVIDQEVYVQFYGFHIDQKNDMDSMEILASFDNRRQAINVAHKDYQWYFEKADPMINLGINTGTANTVKIEFSKAGTYQLDSIKVYQNNLSALPRQVAERKAEALENVTMGVNTLEGTIHVASDKLLTISLPYSKQWTMTVDGNEQEIIKVNDMMMGTMLSKGTHTIQMKYQTPFLKLGAFLSCISFLGFCALIRICYRKPTKN